MPIPELVVFPDVEAVLVDYLNTRLEEASLDYRASTRVPNPRPGTFVRVQRTGGPRLTPRHENPQVTIEAWGPDAPGAAETASYVRALVWQMNTPTAAAVDELGGPAWLPDPDTGHARYVWTAILIARGTTT